MACIESKSVFAHWKLQTLKKADLSKKGSIDVFIEDLVNFINSQEEYCTTSSCSGRICILSDNTLSESVGSKHKKLCEWYLVSHNYITSLDINEALKSVVSCSKLKVEGFVMHIRCWTLAQAQLMLNAAVSSGFRNSGITIGKQGRSIMVAVRGTNCLEVPLTNHCGQVLVSNEYIEYLVDVANKKLSQNFDRVKQYEKLFKNLLLQDMQTDDQTFENKQKTAMKNIRASKADV